MQVIIHNSNHERVLAMSTNCDVRKCKFQNSMHKLTPGICKIIIFRFEFQSKPVRWNFCAQNIRLRNDIQPAPTHAAIIKDLPSKLFNNYVK